MNKSFRNRFSLSTLNKLHLRLDLKSVNFMEEHFNLIFNELAK